MRLKLYLFGLSFIYITCSAQSVYKMSYKTDVSILGAGISLFGLNHPIQNKLNGFTIDELNGLTIEKIPKWDRVAIGLWSPKADIRSDILLYSSALFSASAALIPVIISKKWNTLIPSATILFEVNALTILSTEIVKNVTKRSRPYLYSNEAPISERMMPDARKSFFSGHTSVAAANTFYAAKVFSDHYPNSRLKPIIWATSALIPAVVGCQRILSGKHFLSDVILGYSFGAIIGYALPLLHKK